MNDNLSCPKCGMATMVRKRLLTGKYTIECQKCGLKRGVFKKDLKKDVA